MYILFALLIGFTVVIATILNGKLAERIGIINGVLVNYITGFVASTILMFIVKEKIPTFDVLSTSPIYYFSAGLIGVAIVFLFNITVPKIPVVYIAILPFIGQILSSAIIDYYYFDIFSKGKIIGGILFLIGLLYNIRVDKKYMMVN